MNFKDILAQKMQKNSSATEEPTEVKTASSFNLLHFEPQFTLGETRFKPSEIPYEAGQVLPIKEEPIQVTEQPVLEPEIEVENLDSAGQISLEIFMKLGATELKKQSFSPSELKKSFRKLAKKHHPDLSDQGDSEQFQQLKMAYDTLKEAA